MQTQFESDAENTLIKAWELLGGIVVDGMRAYIKDTVEFETSSATLKKIEKKNCLKEEY